MKEKTLNSMIEEIVSQMKKDDLLARKLLVNKLMRFNYKIGSVYSGIDHWLTNAKQNGRIENVSKGIYKIK